MVRVIAVVRAPWLVSLCGKPPARSRPSRNAWVGLPAATGIVPRNEIRMNACHAENLLLVVAELNPAQTHRVHTRFRTLPADVRRKAPLAFPRGPRARLAVRGTPARKALSGLAVRYRDSSFPEER